MPDNPNIDPQTLNEMFNLALPGPNFVQKKVKMNSNLNIDAWREFEHIIRPSDPYLIDNLEFGFCMGIDQSKFVSVPPTNHKTARQEFTEVDNFIVKHWKAGAILGPYKSNPLSVPVFTSPLQVVTGNSGKKRTVVDMSYPKGSSINDAIPNQWDQIPGFEGSFHLPTHDDICNIILRTPDPLMYITDLSAYYLQLPVDICDLPYMAMAWRKCLWFFRRLPFGSRSACLHAQRVTDAICLIHRTCTRTDIAGYVDDYSGIATRLLAMWACSAFNDLLEKLGLARTLEKCRIPLEIQIFLGLLYNLANLTLSLPQEKIDRAIALIREWLKKDKCTKSELQSLLGNFQHFATVVHAGRPFCSSIMDAVRSENFPVQLSLDFHRDLEMWLHVLQSDIPKKSIIKSAPLCEPDEVIAIAVKGNHIVIECHGDISGYRCYSCEKLTVQDFYIVAVWLITSQLLHVIAGKLILIMVPTKASANAINRASSRTKCIRQLMRQYWLKQAEGDCIVKALCVPGASNDHLFNSCTEFHDIDIV